MKRKYETTGLSLPGADNKKYEGAKVDALDIECLDEGAIVHMYDWQDQQKIWYCIKMEDKYYLVGLSADVVGQVKGGHTDLNEFRTYVAQFDPWIYRHETHKLFIKPKKIFGKYEI